MTARQPIPPGLLALPPIRRRTFLAELVPIGVNNRLFAVGPQSLGVVDVAVDVVPVAEPKAIGDVYRVWHYSFSLTCTRLSRGVTVIT